MRGMIVSEETRTWHRRGRPDPDATRDPPFRVAADLVGASPGSWREEK